MSFASFKNARVVRSGWLEEGGRRLDCNPYMSGALEARDALRCLPKTEPLSQVTSGIFHAGREGRTWVDDPQYGIPFLGSSDILSADLSALPLISKKQVERNPLFKLGESWTLITRSGTIGRMAYVRPDMAGMACSEHVLRVVPNPDRIPPGYLYAFLSSRYGVPLVVSGTYGAIIQHIEPHHLTKIDIPRFDSMVEREIASCVESAAKARSQAAELKKIGIDRFLSEAGLSDISGSPIPISFSTSVANSSDLSRFDSTYFSSHGRNAYAKLSNVKLNPRELGVCARVFTPGIFKRLYVQDAEWGYAYYSGSELFEFSPVARGYLSKRAPGIEEYLIKKNWLLIQDAGQVGGLIGRVTRAGEIVDKSVVSNHLMRIATNSIKDSAFIFAALASPYGYRSITRHAFGSSIPQLDPKHIGSMLIPWMTEEQRLVIGEPIAKAWRLMDFADSQETRARDLIEKTVEEGQH